MADETEDSDGGHGRCKTMKDLLGCVIQLVAYGVFRFLASH
jgi:hypothetical protein